MAAALVWLVVGVAAVLVWLAIAEYFEIRPTPVLLVLAVALLANSARTIRADRASRAALGFAHAPSLWVVKEQSVGAPHSVVIRDVARALDTLEEAGNIVVESRPDRSFARVRTRRRGLVGETVRVWITNVGDGTSHVRISSVSRGCLAFDGGRNAYNVDSVERTLKAIEAR